MKILLGNLDKGWGGGQEHLGALAPELALRGWEVHFLVREGSPSEREFAGGFRTHPVPGKKPVAGVFRIAALLRRERFDLVAVTREHDLPRVALARRLAGSPGKLVVCYHTATRRRQLLLGDASGIVCISTFVAERLRQGNPRLASAPEVILNGIAPPPPLSPQKRDPHRLRRILVGRDFPVIGMVGAMFKNQEELMAVAAAVRREFPRLTVALVGDDGDAGLTGPVRAAASAAGIDDAVVFTGKLPREQMADIFFDLDLSVSTFRQEGFGLVHLESLAAGTPVVCYAEGGQVDIFRGGEAGVLVTGGPAEFAAAVCDLLRNDAWRLALGETGTELVRSRFSLTTMAERYDTFFQSLLGKGGRNGSGR